MAYELRNQYGAKTSALTDVYYSGFIFDSVHEKGDTLLEILKDGMMMKLPSKRMTLADVMRLFNKWENKHVKQ